MLCLCRVSTREQDEEVQVRAVQEFAKLRGIDVVEWFIDRGESGAKPFADRPEARRLLEKLKVDKVDCVVAWSIDRLGRTMMDTLSTVIMLESQGVRAVTVKEECGCRA